MTKMNTHEFQSTAHTHRCRNYRVLMEPYSQGSTTVTFTTAGGHTVLQLLTKEGNFIKTIHEQVYAMAGSHSRQVDLNGLTSDLYYIRIQNGRQVQMKPLIKVR